MQRHTQAAYVQKLSPRVKLAARLYATGACKTKQEASEAAGLNKNYLTLLNNNPYVSDLIREIDKQIETGVVDMSKVLVMLGRKAVVAIAGTMEDSTVKPELRFKAAQDLADRSPETSKTQKLAIDSQLTMTPESAQAIAAALVESARLQETYQSAASGDYIKVDTTQGVKLLPSGGSSGQEGR